MANSKISQLDHETAFEDNSTIWIPVRVNGSTNYIQLNEINPASAGTITNGDLDGDFKVTKTHNLGTKNLTIILRDGNDKFIPETEVQRKASTSNAVIFYFNKSISGTWNYFITSYRTILG